MSVICSILYEIHNVAILGNKVRISRNKVAIMRNKCRFGSDKFRTGRNGNFEIYI